MPNTSRGPTSIKMPADFPTATYRSVYDRVITRANVDKYPDEWKQQFIGSALAIAYRFRACTRHGDAFTRSLAASGNTPDEYDRFTQDQELFNFFVTGLASLESLYYFLHAIGAQLNPADFPFVTDADYRRVDLPRTVARFARAFPGALSDELNRVYAAQEREDWEYTRNVLAHRIASGGRVVYLWTQPPVEPNLIRIGRLQIPLTPDLTKTRRSWLAASLSSILAHTDSFVTGCF